MQALDMFLTRKTQRDVEHTSRNSSIQRPEDFIEGRGDNCYYLSDGGYSRIGFNLETGRLFPTYNSLPIVFERWEFCKELRREVESEIHQAGIRLGWWTAEDMQSEWGA